MCNAGATKWPHSYVCTLLACMHVFVRVCVHCLVAWWWVGRCVVVRMCASISADLLLDAHIHAHAQGHKNTHACARTSVRKLPDLHVGNSPQSRPTHHCPGVHTIALHGPQQHPQATPLQCVSRWKGRRPVVRGIAMNPVDHPMGGGRGKSKGRVSQSPWGKPAKGGRTRKPRNRTDQYIHLSRHKLNA